MASVIFYLLEQEQIANKPAINSLACQLAAQAYRSKKGCLLLCDNQAQAEELDELLWQLPTNAFVPHNLSGEGPAAGTPVEINWGQAHKGNKPLLINLGKELPANHQRFRQIIDFVPFEDALKQQARERYKQYRAAGHQLDTRPGNSINESSDGY